MRALHAVRASQVRGRASHAKQPFCSARRPALEVCEPNRVGLRRRGQVARSSERPAAQSGIQAALAFDLTPPRLGDSIRHRRRALGAGLGDILLRPNSRHVNPQVDPVAQWARHPAGIPIDDCRLAAASAVTLAGMAARASVKK